MTPTNRLPALVGAITIGFALLIAMPAQAAVKIQEVVSPKGVKAWLVEDYTVPLVTWRFAFSGGSTQDPAGKEGLANLMTALFDEGAGDMDSEAFQIRLDDAGAEMSFSESRDNTFGAMRMLAEQKDEGLDLLRLAVTSPRFDAAPIIRIKGQIVSGIQAQARDPNSEAGKRWLKALYGDHPYARPDEGTEASIASISADDLRAFHEAVFARGDLHVAVVGAVDAETLKSDLDKVFGALPDKPNLRDVPDIVPQLGQQVRFDYALPQTTVQLAFPGLARDDPQFFAATLMNHILGGSAFTSRLYREVREKRGLTYGIDSSIVSYDHANALTIGTATRADKADETLGIIREVVKGMAAEGPTETELAAAKRYLIGAYAINNLDSSSSIAATLVALQLDHLGADYIDKRAALIDAVTLAQTKAAAQRLLMAEPAVLIVGPPGAAGTDTPAAVGSGTPALGTEGN